VPGPVELVPPALVEPAAVVPVAPPPPDVVAVAAEVVVSLVVPVAPPVLELVCVVAVELELGGAASGSLPQPTQAAAANRVAPKAG